MKLLPVKFSALNLTHNCNLLCRYCYAGEKSERPMTVQTAMAAIDFLAEHSNGSCVVTFFGGEPLLEFELMKDVVRYSRGKHARKIDFRMNTNGTLLTPEVMRFLAAEEIFFALSLDGHRAQHDCSRCFADGSGSYEAVSGTLKDIFEFNPYTIAVSVIVPETAQYLADGVKHLFAEGFRYVLQTLDYSADWKNRDIRSLERQYAELAEFYFRALSDGRKIYYSPFDERIKTHADKPYGRGDLCDLANTQIAIAPSGRIYPCVQFIGEDDESCRVNSIGDVKNGFNNSTRALFVEENYRDKVSCAGCALNGRCATFCGCVNWRATGHLDRIPPIICEHERMLMPIVDKMANRLWKKNVELFKRKFYERTFPVSSYIEDCMIKRRGGDA